jgi:hypothetical protein
LQGYLSYVAIPEQESIISKPIFAQVDLPFDMILMNKTNMTTNLLLLYLKIPIISAPDTLIGRSTPPTTSKITLPTNEVNNKSGQAESVGGIK